jgi:O-antigen/teichoic acid export membrane protein
MIHISRRDVIWSYFAQFFGIASGIITLPLILRSLSVEEIGMNYLMLTIGSLVTLFDFGFSPQFGRNITYVYSGAQELQKEGIEIPVNQSVINFRLLAVLIKTAKYVYRRLGFIILILMLSFGSIYIYYVTNSFTSIKNSLLIWILYSISTFFNVYYSYYTSLLIGKGLIKESRKAIVYSKIVYIIFTFIFLFLGWGLLGVTLANLIAPFVNRWIAYTYFFTDDLITQINHFEVRSSEVKDLFNIIWLWFQYNYFSTSHHHAKMLYILFELIEHIY